MITIRPKTVSITNDVAASTNGPAAIEVQLYVSIVLSGSLDSRWGGLWCGTRDLPLNTGLCNQDDPAC